jgi:heme iron utilization protein
MKSSDEQAHAARQVLAGTFQGVLSTHSLEQAGYPFGSVVPYVLDRDGLPLLLLSHLSQHTKNLDADGRCGLTVVEMGDGDVQERGRLSAVGDVTPSGLDADFECYFRYFPHARMYFEQLLELDPSREMVLATEKLRWCVWLEPTQDQATANREAKVRARAWSDL